MNTAITFQIITGREAIRGYQSAGTPPTSRQEANTTVRKRLRKILIPFVRLPGPLQFRMRETQIGAKETRNTSAASG